MARRWMDKPLHSVRRDVAMCLRKAGIAEAEQESRHVLAALYAAGDAGRWLDPDVRLNAEQARRLETMCRRREAREPLPHILGEWGFWSFDLMVSKDVLTPRPETETLVQCALDALPDGCARFVDLGTGSGAIALALLRTWPQAEAVVVELSPCALDVARDNAKALGLDDRVTFIEGGWDAALALGPFDLVVSNPPYIAHDEIATLAPEVCDFEPRLALDGGADGLDAYRAILPLLSHYLMPGGFFALEIGAGQEAAVCTLARGPGELCSLELKPDMAGRKRVLCGRHC